MKSVAGELIVQVLEQLPIDHARESEAGHVPQIDVWAISSLFERLDRSARFSGEVIARLEVPYVQLLSFDRPNLALHREVMKNPTLFADLISWAFKRSDGQTEEVVDEQTLYRQAETACYILRGLRGLPGLTEGGEVAVVVLSAWVSEARGICKERGREVIGDHQIGQILANAPIGSDGTWPCAAVRDLLDDLSSPNIGTGFIIGKHNLRGVTGRRMLDGGGQERSLSAIYREGASKVTTKWPFTAKLLRQIAASYESEGQLHDFRSDWSDQFDL